MSADSAPFIRTLQRLRAAFWRRRFLRGLIRSLWLALLVPTIVMAGYLWFSWQIPWINWLAAALLVAAVSLLWSLRPIGLKPMTHRLDYLLNARARLITAFEVSQTAAPVSNPVADKLLHDAVGLSVAARRQVKTFNRGFWLEVNALIAVAAILGAMLVLDAFTRSFPQATPVDLPPPLAEPRADELLPPDARLLPPPFQQPPMSAAQTQAALEALAEALRDQAVSRSVAEALDRGDMAGAAQELRRLADQLEGLSEQAQRELGDALNEARENMGGDVPGFSGPLQQGSESLDSGDLPQAGQALEELADTLEGIEMEPQPGAQPGASDQPAAGEQTPADEPAQAGQGDGAGGGEEGEGEQGLEDAAERLPFDGQPLELESEGKVEDRVLQPSELDAQSGEGRTSDSPFAHQPLNTGGEDLGADPLTYPWEQRDVVKRYFTPQD